MDNGNDKNKLFKWRQNEVMRLGQGVQIASIITHIKALKLN